MNNKVLIVGQENSLKFPNARPWSCGASSERLWSWFNVKSFKELSKFADTFNVNNKEDISIDEKINRGRYEMIFLIGSVANEAYERRRLFIRHEHMAERLLHPSGRNFQCNFKDSDMYAVIKHALQVRAKWRRDHD